MRTVVEVLARIGGHGFGRGLAAAWTGQGRDELHHAPPSARMSGCSIYPHKADTATTRVASDSMMTAARSWASEAHPPDEQARLQRTSSNQPMETAAPAARVSGQRRGTRTEIGRAHV